MTGFGKPRPLTDAERAEWKQILAANASEPVRRPLSVDRLTEIDHRVDWLEWTLTQEQTPLVTSQWRYLLTDARDLLAAFAEAAH